MKTLIKNGTLITAETTRKADILVEGETIRRIDDHIEDPEAALVDATGLFVEQHAGHRITPYSPPSWTSGARC